jgi:hypothetical protein
VARLGRGQPFRPRILKPPAVAAQATFTGSGTFQIGVPTFASQGIETFSDAGAVTYQVSLAAVGAETFTANGAFAASASFTGAATAISPVTATGAFAINAIFSGVGSTPFIAHGGGMRPGAVQWRGRILERPREPAIALVLADDPEDFVYFLALTQGR